jgi:hypothetical protein
MSQSLNKRPKVHQEFRLLDATRKFMYNPSWSAAMQRVVFVLLVAVNAAAALQAQADESGDAVADGAVSTSRETAPPAAAIESLCCRPSAFTVDVDTLCLQPARGNGVTLGRTFDVTNGNTLETLSSNDAGFDMQAGLRFRLLWQRDACTAWEGVYFGMQTWDGGSSITPDFAVAGTLADSPWTQTDKLVGGFDQSLSFHSMARLNNVEINRRRLLDCNCGASIEWLAGLRYIQWDESLTLDGLNSLPPAFEELEVRCQNQMVGPQIGAEVRRNWDHWYLTVEGKAALMANIYRQRRSNMNSSGVQPNGYPAIAPLDDDNSGGCVAGAVDLSIVAALPLGEHFSARGGYQLLYLTGLAQAPAQLGGFDRSGDVFLHGPMAGLELNW